MEWLRSLLFVPGNKPDWVEKAWRSAPDGLIIDLEDAVPHPAKEKSRAMVREVLEQSDSDSYFCVRINSWATGLVLDDIQSVVHPHLDAIMLPKVYRAEELTRLSAHIDVVERQNGVEPGHTAIILLLETALGIRHAFDIASACPRVSAILMAAGPGGDAQRAIGYRWSKDGKETLYLRSKIVLEARAAGVAPLITSWFDVRDVDGLKADAQLNRSLGYTGMALIHPSHVAPVNAVFTPDPAEIRFYKGLVTAFEDAENRGEAAVVYEGDMVDAAMAETARSFLSRAAELGLVD